MLVMVREPKWLYNSGTLKSEGPVVRIAPNELHINDPEVFLEMTRVGSRFTKDPTFYSFITFPGTSIGEHDPEAHRIRRQVLTPAFSPARVQQIAPMIKSKVDEVLARFEDFAARGEPLNFFASTKAFTMDVISTIVFGKALGCIRDPQFGNQFIEFLHTTFEMGWVAPAFPNLIRLSYSLPESIAERVFPIPLFEFKKVCCMQESDESIYRNRLAINTQLEVPWNNERLLTSSGCTSDRRLQHEQERGV